MEFEDMNLETFQKKMYKMMQEQWRLDRQKERDAVMRPLFRDRFRTELRYRLLARAKLMKKKEKITDDLIYHLATSIALCVAQAVGYPEPKTERIIECSEFLAKEITEVFSMSERELNAEIERTREKEARLSKTIDKELSS